MAERFKQKILLVDDEESILKSLRRLLKALDLDILATTNGEEALRFIQKEHIALIISDQRMPGISGVELLEKCKDISPDTIRILLTGYADIDATIAAINNGAVKYYLNKPWDNDTLLSRVKESIDLYNTIIENRRLQKLTEKQNRQLKDFNENLQKKVDEQTSEIKRQNEELNKSFMETIKAFSTLIELRLKDVGSHSQRVALLVKNMLKGFELTNQEYQDIVVAAYLHDIGKISLPDKVIKKDRSEYTKTEQQLIAKHPSLGQTCVYNISGFEEIGVIIRNHHENYDGSGYPDHLVGEQTSLGAKIIRICDEFDYHAFKGGYPDLRTLNEATAKLVQDSGTKFDPDLIKKFIDLDIASSLYHNESTDIIDMSPIDLKEEMVVADDVYTQNGMFLLPKGAKLSEGMISRITKINRVDPIKGGVKVYKATSLQKDNYVPV